MSNTNAKILKFKTSLFVFLSFGFLSIGLVNCVPKKDAITIVYDAMPASFDPHLKREIVTISILSNIYETLVTFDASMKMLPSIAEYWEKVDTLAWRFYLRKGIRFHNQKRLQADDVIYSLYRPSRLSNSEYTVLKNYIDTIIAEDTDKVLIKLKIPHSFLLYDIANLFIVPLGFDSLRDSFCGTGPYKLEKIKENYIQLVKFSDYWNKKPPIEEVNILFIRNVEQRIKMLKEKTADIITFIPLTHLNLLKEAGRVMATPGAATRYIEMNLNKFPFNKVEFRQAINLAINRELIAQDVYQGFATPANQYINQGLFGFDYNLPQCPCNPDSAKKLLKKFRNLPVIDFTFAESRSFIARAITEDLKRIGLKINPRSLPVEEYWEVIEGGKSNFFLIGSVPLSNEGVSLLISSFHTYEPSKGLGVSNRIGYSNNEFDMLIKKIISNSDLRICAKFLVEAQRILIKDLPKIPVVWEKEIYGVSDRIIWEPRIDELIIVKEVKLKND